MSISHSDVVKSLRFQSNEILRFSKLMLMLQILVALPAIISIIFPSMPSVVFLMISLISVIILCYYWRIKYKYFSQKFKTSDARRALLLKVGFKTSSPSDGTLSTSAGPKYDLQNKENCVHFLNVLYAFSSCNELIYKKCEDFLRWILFILLIIVIILFVLIVAYAEEDLNITIARAILSAVILFFSSDILNMIFVHRFVSERLIGLTERLQKIEGNDNIEIEVLRTVVIKEFGFYADTMSSSYEIFPFFYNRYNIDLQNKLDNIDIVSKEVKE